MRLSPKIQGQKATSAKEASFSTPTVVLRISEVLRVKKARGGQESFKGVEIIDCLQLVGYQGEARLPPLLGSGRLSWTPMSVKSVLGVRGERRR